ncbi:AAA family ATPase [uncultured Arcobacter sp.]|uniref:AAA family ATPase n=1 Tax=uncultured Arcobacter sp. TaxID=165434 RepID=UPI00262B8DF9|nr:AAA family ATPase [uncultured Arcobacter sp.]
MSLLRRFYDDKGWIHKYRPKTVDELIIPDNLKEYAKNIIESENIGSILLNGRAGIGKTSFAFVLADTLEYDTLYINCSVKTGIDVLRTDIQDFAYSMSLEHDKKVVILDEMDRLSPNTMDGLKSFMEEFSSTTDFICITNHKDKLPEPVISRTEDIEFSLSKDDKVKLAKQFYARFVKILESENAPCNKDVCKHLMATYFPDMRKILIEAQKLNKQGILGDYDVVRSKIIDGSETYNLINDAVKNGVNYPKIRKFVMQYGDADTFFSYVFETFHKNVKPEFIPQMALMIEEHSYKSKFSADIQINLTAFIMDVILLINGD